MATIRKRSWRTAKGEQREAWQVDFVDAQGKRRHRQFDRKKDADAWLVQARGQVASGTFSADSASPTVAQAAELWLARCERDGLERSTLTQYRGHVRHHIEPLIGAVKLSRLTRPAVEAFADQLLSSGRSRATAGKVIGSLKAIIGEAQRRGLVAQNVAAGVVVRHAARHKGKVQIPTQAAVKAALAGATGRTRALLVLAVFTGLRASEMRGLRWQDVDFERRQLQVRQRADTSGKIGALKSPSSRRDVPMSPMVVNTLREWRLATGGRDGLVFPGRGERPLCHNTVMAAIGGRAHPYRHFFASWLIDRGFGPKRVMALMGHSSIQVTFDTYGHLLPTESDHDKFAAGELALVG